jgi:ribosomal protein S18 acetylase RimI-like enzyme
LANNSPLLVPASHFSIQTLTDAYNKTRVDYMVPMPLNASRLAQYIRIYDIDVENSVVAKDGEQILGINMLGIRRNRTWITRLGVLPVKRRQGSGEYMTRYLLNISDQIGQEKITVEVIKNNTPAHNLFKKLGFIETRELIVMRRPPNGDYLTPSAKIDWLESDAVFELLSAYPNNLAWTNQLETYVNFGTISGIYCTLPDGHRGWMIYRKDNFYLTHFILHTESGEPTKVAQALLAGLHKKYPKLDTHIENIPIDDPHLPAFRFFGYLEAFRRIEMSKKIK